LYATIVEEDYMDAPIFQLVRNIDAIKSEKEYIQSQVGSDIDKIDIKARNSFYEGATISMLKYLLKFNYHGSRDRMIDKSLILSGCPQCTEYEE